MADLMTLLQKLGDGEIDDLSSAYAEACFYADDAMDEIVTLREKVVELESKIAELEAKLERVRELPEYAVQTGGWGGWEIVPAEGFEAQTFVDKDQLDAALKETEDQR